MRPAMSESRPSYRYMSVTTVSETDVTVPKRCAIFESCHQQSILPGVPILVVIAYSTASTVLLNIYKTHMGVGSGEGEFFFEFSSKNARFYAFYCEKLLVDRNRDRGEA